MAKIIWSDSALSDLNDIAEYIALDKESAAKKLVRNLFSSIERLEQFPESGRVPAELIDSKYREIIVGPCRVFYRIENDNDVYVVYVMRGERALRRYMLEEREG